jgi:hypothetical protein
VKWKCGLETRKNDRVTIDHHQTFAERFWSSVCPERCVPTEFGDCLVLETRKVTSFGSMRNFRSETYSYSSSL